MDQAIRVSAKGDFASLTRGLKQLKGDLKNVTDEMSKGARNNGFNEAQLRALDVFKQRFTSTLKAIDDEFEKQNKVIEDMYGNLDKAQNSHKSGIQSTIQQMERQLDVYRKQVIEMERVLALQERLAQTMTGSGTGSSARLNPEDLPSFLRPRGKVPPAPSPAPAPAPAPSGGNAAGSPNKGTQTPPAGVKIAAMNFSQLEDALKNLDRELKEITNEVNKGARKGGLFSEDNVRALDLFKQRFRDTMSEVDQAFDRQNQIIDDLHEKMKTAQGAERAAIKKNITEREKELDVMRQQVFAAEKLYNNRTSEASKYEVKSGDGDVDAEQLNGTTKKSPLDTMLKTKMMMGVGLAKGTLALAGIGGLGSVLAESYQQAYTKEVGSLDLAQRLRGTAGRSGSATEMYDGASEVGRRDNLGYSATESWGFLDQYSRLAGGMDLTSQEGMMKFARGYGLSTSEVAGLTGASSQLGGTSSPNELADAIAGSVKESGMTPRILEVMQTNNVLLSQMNTTLKDGSAKQILAYQSTLDTIGNQNGMQQLTGAQGASLIGGLGGIFKPGDDNWKWMGIRALQSYKPEKYGKMDLYDLEMNYEDGLMNPDNIPAMADYVNSQTGGNEKLNKRIMQRWLTDGGYAATKREASEFYDATNGLKSFSPEQMEALKNGSIDSTAAYTDNRQNEGGQGILQANAEYEKALEGIGSEFIDVITKVKEIAAEAATDLTSFADALDNVTESILDMLPPWLQKTLTAVGDFVSDNPWAAAGVGVAAGAGAKGLKGLTDKAKANKAAAAATEADAAAARAAGAARAGAAGAAEAGAAGAAAGAGAKQAGKGLLKGGKGLLKGLGKLAAPLGAFLIGQETEERMASGESGWDAFANSLLNGITFGLTDKMGVTTPELQDRNQTNIAKNKASDLTYWKNNYKATRGPLITMDNGTFYGGATHRSKKEAQYVYDHLKEMGIDPSTADGTDLISGAMTGSFGITVDSLPDELRKYRKQFGVDNVKREPGSYSDKDLENAIITYFGGGRSSGGGTWGKSPDAGDSGLGHAAYFGGGMGIGNLLYNPGTGDTIEHPLMTKKTDDSISTMETKIETFSEDGSEYLAGMTDNGTKYLLKFKDGGVEFFDTTTEEHKEKLKAILSEHKGLKSFFSKEIDPVLTGFDKMFSEVSSTMAALASGIGMASVTGDAPLGNLLGSGAGENFDIRGTDMNISAKQIEDQLGGKLKGYGGQFLFAGQKYGINPAVLAAISMQETGNGTSPALRDRNNVGGMMKKTGGLRNFNSISESIDAMASNLKRNYIDQGITTITGVQQKYAPINAKNDPNGLNNHWTPGVLKYLDQLGVKTDAGGPGLKSGSYFSGWQNRVTSRFGSQEAFRKKPHGGLDINGEQGDALQALMSGTISFIKYDDGSAKDADGKKNTRGGGTELGIKLADGSTYFYSHLSEVAKGLQEGQKVAAGQYVGKVGGDPGKPGSGSSTTGSHLHLGYMDKNNVLMDPELLMKQLDIGDSSIGKMADQMPLQNRADLAAALASQSSGDRNINITITGSGAAALNGMTEAQLKSLIKQTFKEEKRSEVMSTTNSRGR